MARLFSGGGVKSIQSGSTSAGGSLSATINAVDLDKSVIITGFTNGLEGSSNDTAISATAYLLDETTIKIVRGNGQGNNSISTYPVVYWTVIEYA